MKFIARKMAVSSVSLSALGLVAALPLQGACGSAIGTTTPADGGPGATITPDPGPRPPPIGFTPSNISLSGIDLSKIRDEDVSKECTIGTGMGDFQGCFASAGDGVVVQSDGSKVRVVVVKSLRLEPSGHISVTGGLPLALVSLGDMTLLGPLDAHATVSAGAGGTANAGGFSSLLGTRGKGAGPGGGAGPIGNPQSAASAGGSYCGQGGQGAVEIATAGTPAAPTASYGTPEIVPLVGGSSGGNGGGYSPGAGGGALQLVAKGAFTMGSASSINVGGGGGGVGFGAPGGFDASGGGSGGSILIEATTVKVAGLLTSNGGGGAGGGTGHGRGDDATADATAAAGGLGASVGGAGSARASINGANAAASRMAGGAAVDGAGSGGGGAGRIRINSMTGSANLTGATISPDVSTSCATQGTVAP